MSPSLRFIKITLNKETKIYIKKKNQIHIFLFVVFMIKVGEDKKGDVGWKDTEALISSHDHECKKRASTPQSRLLMLI